MKIVYPAFIRLPTEKAHGAQIMKTCEAFANNGASLELLLPGRKTHIEEDAFSYYDVQINFVLKALNAVDLVGKSVLGTLVSQISFTIAVLFEKSFWQADIIYSRDAGTLLFYLPFAKKLVYEAHVKPTRMAQFVAKRVHRLVVISEGLIDAYIEAGIAPEKITVAHDAVDPKPFKQQYNKFAERTRLGIPLKMKVALYVGRIDEAKGADTLAAASEFVPDDTLCVLIGSGPGKDALQKKYPKALFLPETPYKDLPRVLATADVLILPNSAKDETMSRYTSPLKAFAYLATRKPILATAVPALCEILSKNATYCIPDNPRLLAEAIPLASSSSFDREIQSWDMRASIILRAIV